MGWKHPLCRWPFPRLCGFPSLGAAGANSTPDGILSSSWASVQGVSRRILACGVQPPAPPMSFPCPTAHQAARIHWSRVLPARYVPPSGFDYPLDGLLPSGPCQLCFMLTALLGFPFGACPHRRYPNVTARVNPPTVSSSAEAGTEAPTRHAGLRFLGFDPPASPGRPDAL
jgi:hypothetical protein